MRGDGQVYSEETECLEPRSFDWDGEEYGNPRIIDGAPDIGFDEIHLYVQAGSWGNDSASHNVPGTLNPSAPQGRLTRFFLFPRDSAGIDIRGAEIEVDGTFKASPAPVFPAWTRPPKSLASPVTNPALPFYYRTRYIGLGNNGTPTPWIMTLPGIVMSWGPPGSVATNQFVSFLPASMIDDECSPGPCEDGYFNTMVQVRQSGQLILWSNLQAEYR